MKYIKLFENTNEPKVGDYVLLNIDKFTTLVSSVVYNNIGQIKRIYGTFNNTYNVEFDVKIPIINSNIISVSKTDIQIFTHNKEELEEIIMSRRYNL